MPVEHRPVLQHVRREDPRRPRRRTCRASATRSPAAARTSTATIQTAPALLRHLQLGDGEPRRPAHGPAELLQGARPTPRASSRRSRRSTRACSPTMADTFEALVARSAGAARTRSPSSPPTLDVAHRVAARAAPVPRAHRGVLRATSTGAPTELRGALPTLNRALRRSARRCSAARSRSTTSCRTRSTRCSDLVEAPTTIGALRGLTATVDTLQPQLRYLGPYVTVCNDWNNFWTFAAEHFSAPDATGASERALLNWPAAQPGRRHRRAGRQRVRQRQGRAARQRRVTQYLHDNFYGAAVDAKRRRRLRRPASSGYIYASNPYDPSVRATPTSVRRSTSASRPARAGPTYAQFDREGKGVGLNPDARAGRRDVHRPARRPRRRHREARAMEASERSEARHAPVHAPALITLVVLVAVDLPGLHQVDPVPAPLQIQAVFRDRQQHPRDSPVRIAGVERRQGHRVERVAQGRTRRAGDDARSTRRACRSTRTRRCKIRPRIFLEGNFFVDLSPGSPSAPELGDGDTIPINQTARRCSSTRCSARCRRDTRKDLQARARRAARRAWPAGRRAGLQPLDPVLEAAPTATARSSPTRSLGIQRARPRRATSTSAGATAAALDRNGAQLKTPDHGLQHDRGRVRRARQRPEHAIGELPRTLRAGMPALARAQRRRSRRCALRPRRPPGRALERPGDRRDVPFVAQLRAARAPSPSCAAWPHDLRPTVPALAQLHRGVAAALPAGRAGVELPERRDPAVDQGQDRRPGRSRPTARSTRRSTKPLPGLAGESRSGDANGQWFRVLLTPAELRLPDAHRQRSSSPAQPIQGVNPPPPNRPRPPLRPTCRARPSSRPTCAPSPPTPPTAAQGRPRARRSGRRDQGARRQAVDWLRGAAQAPRAAAKLKVSDSRSPRCQIGKAAASEPRSASTCATSSAIIGLVVIALRRRRLHPRTTSACASRRQGAAVRRSRPSSPTAQAVTPGQGQTVRVAGVRVGDISKVELKDGHAVVTMDARPASTRTSSTPTRPRCCGPRPA